MKKILTFLFLACLTTVVVAQTNTIKTDQKTTPKKTVKSPTYCCPGCEYCSEQEGTCPQHKTLIKEGTYFCENGCESTAESAGKCPKCNNEMKKMVKKPKRKESKKEQTK